MNELKKRLVEAMKTYNSANYLKKEAEDKKACGSYIKNVCEMMTSQAFLIQNIISEMKENNSDIDSITFIIDDCGEYKSYKITYKETCYVEI